MASNDFTIDKQEYQSVFRVFDKGNTGTISIQQVNEYIQKFEEVQIRPTAGAQMKKSKIGKEVPESGKLRNGSHQQQYNDLGQGGPSSQDQKQLSSSGTSAHHPNSLSMNGYKRPGRTLNQASSFNGANNQHLNSQNKASATKPGVGSSKYQSPTKRFQQQQHSGLSQPQQNQAKESLSTGLQIKPRQLPNAQSSENQNVNGTGDGANKQGSRRTELPQRINDNSSGNTSEDQKQTANQTQIDTAASSSQSNPQQKLLTTQGHPSITSFPNGKKSLQFEEFIELIKESCMDQESAENYLVYAFSMFDREKKGYINLDDLSVVFSLLGETISEEELATMIKIAGVKSNDKINFKEFVDFFYKVD